MPTFDVDSLSIYPDEYVDACSARDIKKLLEAISESYPEEYEEFIADDVEELIQGDKEDIRSHSQRVFNRNLNHLRLSWYSISGSDMGVIAILAKKYGAV